MGENETKWLTQQRAVDTGLFEDIPRSLALRSIGYKSLPMEIDDRVHHSPCDYKRPGSHCADADQWKKASVIGVHSTCWVNVAPMSFIGSNIGNARETVRCIMDCVADARLSGEETRRSRILEVREKRLELRCSQSHEARGSSFVSKRRADVSRIY